MAKKQHIAHGKMPARKMALPTSLLKEAKTVNQQHWTYPGMDVYAEQEKVIDRLFRKTWAHVHTRIDIVKSKVATLNIYYGTCIQAVTTLAKGICTIDQQTNMDNRLQNGDLTLVNDIAGILPKRRNLSFSTKYCACHNPVAYPIYDSLVANYLAAVIAKGNLNITGLSIPSTAQMKVLRQMHANYPLYVDIYKAFVKQCHLTSLTYRQVDWYIWTACKFQNNQINIFGQQLNLFKLI